MKFIYVVALIALSAVCGSSEEIGNESQQRPVICEAGSVEMKECNRCRCSRNGRMWLCTKKACPESLNNFTSPSRRPPLTDRMALLPVTSPSTQPSVTSECVPGTRFKQDCNTCFCGSNGVAACTLRGCVTGTPTINIPIVNHTRAKRQTADRVYTLDDLKDPNFTCTPNYSFKLECNTCWCSADGHTPRYCTRIACNPKTYPLNLQTEGN